MSDGIEPIARAERPIAPGTTIGHANLRTADIDRIRDFYVGVLGFDVMARIGDQFPKIKRFSTNVVLERIKSGGPLPRRGRSPAGARRDRGRCSRSSCR